MRNGLLILLWYAIMNSVSRDWAYDSRYSFLSEQL